LLQQWPRAARKSAVIAPLPSSIGRSALPQARQSTLAAACAVLRQVGQNRSVRVGM
jgi:hypothetical protein